jgi:hypothetical protein
LLVLLSFQKQDSEQGDAEVEMRVEMAVEMAVGSLAEGRLWESQLLGEAEGCQC